ncbi:MAG: hypothetical protein U0235_11400 [Polyangiaceae bacterium]
MSDERAYDVARLAILRRRSLEQAQRERRAGMLRDERLREREGPRRRAPEAPQRELGGRNRRARPARRHLEDLIVRRIRCRMRLGAAPRHAGRALLEEARVTRRIERRRQERERATVVAESVLGDVSGAHQKSRTHHRLRRELGQLDPSFLGTLVVGFVQELGDHRMRARFGRIDRDGRVRSRERGVCGFEVHALDAGASEQEVHLRGGRPAVRNRSGEIDIERLPPSTGFVETAASEPRLAMRRVAFENAVE